MLTLVGWIRSSAQVVAHGGTGEVEMTSNRRDALAADEMTTPDLGDDVHG